MKSGDTASLSVGSGVMEDYSLLDFTKDPGSPSCTSPWEKEKLFDCSKLSITDLSMSSRFLPPPPGTLKSRWGPGTDRIILRMSTFQLIEFEVELKALFCYLTCFTQGLAVKTTQEVKSLLLLTCFSHLYTT